MVASPLDLYHQRGALLARQAVSLFPTQLNLDDPTSTARGFIATPYVAQTGAHISFKFASGFWLVDYSRSVEARREHKRKDYTHKQ